MYGFVTENVMEQSLNGGCIDPSWDVVTPTGSIIEDILSVLYIQLFFLYSKQDKLQGICIIPTKKMKRY